MKEKSPDAVIYIRHNVSERGGHSRGLLPSLPIGTRPAMDKIRITEYKDDNSRCFANYLIIKICSHLTLYCLSALGWSGRCLPHTPLLDLLDQPDLDRLPGLDVPLLLLLVQLDPSSLLSILTSNRPIHPSRTHLLCQPPSFPCPRPPCPFRPPSCPHPDV